MKSICPLGNFLLTIGLLFLATSHLQAQPEIAIIPEPKTIENQEGSFTLSNATRLRVNDAALETTASLLNDLLVADYGVTLRKGASNKNGLRLLLDPKVSGEAYTLTVDPSGITITGSAPGVFYGVQTLRQLIAPTEDGTLSVPCVRIEDEPRFGYRGLMLDVGRHFYPVDFIKKFIDVMAQYKLNRFHWSFTQDAGWRIEIKHYPALTQLGAWRRSTQHERERPEGDGIAHGGFYTQEEIRDVIRYAADRQVTIVPEINMPGHTMAALAVFPELSCTGGPFAVQHTWGIKDEVLCLGNEETYRFAKNVFTEIFDLFPGDLIHIGGDEAPRKRWSVCPKCQAKIKQEGLKDEHELQSYFVHWLSDLAAAHGKHIMGWDEILQGGLAPGATVMSWRGEEGGIAAARMGNPVVMAPKHFFYLDYYQSQDRTAEPYNIGGYVPLEKTYSYEPYGPQLTPEQCRFISGVQGNIWCEYIHTNEKVWYMGYPRALAVAEVGWSPAAKKDFDSFRSRLVNNLYRLDREGVLYRIPEPAGLYEAEVRDGKAIIRLESPVRNAKIYYTTDGSDPWVYGKLYTAPIEVPLGFEGVDVQCIVRLESGRASAVYKAIPKPLTEGQ